ncbi:hypothetical protein BGZ47_004770 [Haplosporangium gracile]|nr:hypothetical protein BGZ47_004770 [Haplosporangium gracile]
MQPTSSPELSAAPSVESDHSARLTRKPTNALRKMLSPKGKIADETPAKAKTTDNLTPLQAAAKILTKNLTKITKTSTSARADAKSNIKSAAKSTIKVPIKTTKFASKASAKATVAKPTIPIGTPTATTVSTTPAIEKNDITSGTGFVIDLSSKLGTAEQSERGRDPTPKNQLSSTGAKSSTSSSSSTSRTARRKRTPSTA